jgi:hypothetical protein
VASYNGSVCGVSAATVIALTAPVVATGWPDALTNANEPVMTKPPAELGAIALTNELLTAPTYAPAGVKAGCRRAPPRRTDILKPSLWQPSPIRSDRT